MYFILKMEGVSKISLAEIKKKLNKKSAIIDFFRELGIFTFNLFIILGYYYLNFSCFNYDFCLQVLAGKKKSNINNDY